MKKGMNELNRLIYIACQGAKRWNINDIKKKLEIINNNKDIKPMRLLNLINIRLRQLEVEGYTTYKVKKCKICRKYILFEYYYSKGERKIDSICKDCYNINHHT